MSVLITNMEEIPEHGTVMVVVHSDDGKKYIKPIGFCGCSMELVERKKGHWEEITDYYNRISGRCSVCGWESHLYEDDVVGMPYCPNCGSYMREEGEQDD